MKPSREQIKIEVEKLWEIRPSVRHFTLFNDHAAIDAEIDVPENDLGDDDIYDAYDGNEHVLSSALQAREWLNEGGEASSDSWRDLIIRKENDDPS